MNYQTKAQSTSSRSKLLAFAALSLVLLAGFIAHFRPALPWTDLFQAEDRDEVLREFTQAGRERGAYDAAHRLHDYRQDFREDPAMVTTYLAYNVDAEGHHDPGCDRLLAHLRRSGGADRNRVLLAAFVKAYAGGFTEARTQHMGS